jgi:serine/threonine-protein kinase
VNFCPHCSAFYPAGVVSCPDDGTPLKPTLDPYLGRTIASRYRLVRRLGSGGMSAVYLAHHVMIERLSALKILRDELSRNPMHRERFLREARAVNRINHPNIVEISDLGEADGVVYLVMEYVDGPSLHEEIDRGILPWPRAARIGMQVAAALARAHQMGVVHRDLKPENILLDVHRTGSIAPTGSLPPFAMSEDLVKLTDFGIAKILDEPALTLGEALFGTPGYIAPEYLEGATSDPRSDLYSLGVVLYETTTGRLPYDETGGALLFASLKGAPIPPSKRVPHYVQELEDLILRLLARDPAARPPDAFAVQDALGRLLVGEAYDSLPALATPPPPTPLLYGSERGRDAVKEAVGRAPTDPALQAPQTPAPSRAGTLVAATRWHEALLELEATIAAARRRRAPVQRVERAAELAAMVRLNILSLERVSRAVLAAQHRVDELEAEGRSFRASIGSAIDELVLDRSRARTHREAAKERLEAMTEDASGDRRSDAVLWEGAALAVEGGKSAVMERDLAFQIEKLEQSLHDRNVALEQDILEASGALEGSLAAIKHLTCELDRLLLEATGLVGEPDGAATEQPRALVPGQQAPRR